MARVALVAGAAGSVALMLRAGARQRSALLILLFTGWVLSPFVALAVGNLYAPHWQPRLRTVLHVTIVAVSALCLFFYAMHALTGAAKAGFVYLVVPALAWLGIVVTLGVTAVVRAGRTKP
jgi:hypothetical protein